MIITIFSGGGGNREIFELLLMLLFLVLVHVIAEGAVIHAVQCHIAVIDTNCQQRILRIRFPYNIFFLSAAAATTVIISAIIVVDISPLVIVQQKFLFLARRIVEKESSFQVETVVLHGPNGQVEMGQHT